MGGYWGGFVTGSIITCIFTSAISAVVWIRALVRDNKDLKDMQRESLAHISEQLAVTRVIHKDAIRENADEIEKTQQLVRSRPLDS